MDLLRSTAEAISAQDSRPSPLHTYDSGGESSLVSGFIPGHPVRAVMDTSLCACSQFPLSNILLDGYSLHRNDAKFDLIMQFPPVDQDEPSLDRGFLDQYTNISIVYIIRSCLVSF